MISPTERPLPDNTQHLQKKDIHASPSGFEPAITGSEGPQTHALNIDIYIYIYIYIWEERRLRVFENRVLRRIFGPKRDEVTGEWRKLHNEGLSDL